MKRKNERGITLIALIITIIIMLTFAGIVLSLTIGENGIFKTAKYAVQKNSEETAREKLELALADLISHKYTNENYNENEYINNYLKNEDMTVVDNVVTVDNWNFEIDRSVPCIKTNLGASEVKLTKEVKEYLGKNENDKYEVSVLVKIECNTKIESIEFENTDGTILTVKVEKETLAKDMQIELDREYKIAVKIANGKTINRIIVERSVENIKTAEELAEFRDKVNTGLTYEGKTVNLVNNIDLSSVCGKDVNGQEISWEPIGTDKGYFKGTFEGNYHTLSNLYYNSNTYNYVGLFTQNNGTIQNLILDNVYIYADKTGTHEQISAGGISGANNEIIMNCGINSGDIIAYNMSTTTSVWRGVYAGGIAGNNIGKTINCYNIANITAQTNKDDSVRTTAYAGGIIGTSINSLQIENCYNKGRINSSGSVSMSGGIVAEAWRNLSYSSVMKNCYSINSVTASANPKNYTLVGGLIGRNGNNITGRYLIEISNCYCSTSTTYSYYCWNGVLGNPSTSGKVSPTENLKTYASTLGTAFENDDSNINNGYPILKWQLEIK